MDGACWVCFLLPAFIYLGHECQDLLSLCVCVQTRPQFILSSERVVGNGVKTHVNSKRKIPYTGGSEKDQTHDTASRRTASPTHYQLSYSSPLQHSPKWTLQHVLHRTSHKALGDYNTHQNELLDTSTTEHPIRLWVTTTLTKMNSSIRPSQNIP